MVFWQLLVPVVLYNVGRNHFEEDLILPNFLTQFLIIYIMKHIRLFNTKSQYDSATLDLPNVSYVKGNNTVYYNPNKPDYSKEYLTFQSLADNNIISFKASSSSFTKTISVSTDNGTTWTQYTSTTSGVTIATLNNGDKILLKGTNSQYSSNKSNSNQFISNGNVNIRGNIMSLISGDSFEDSVVFSSDYTFNRMFRELLIIDAEDLILPATTLSQYCYRAMFQGCTSLTTAPVLPATILVKGCYMDMFEYCTSLTTAPELPATVLTDECYYMMFDQCTSLNSITCLATDISATQCTEFWVTDISANGTFTKAASMNSWTTGDDGIPSGWTVQNAS